MIADPGIENHTCIDSLMALRVLCCDAESYLLQMADRRNSRKNDLDPDADKTNEEIVPVITMVLYTGLKRRWNVSGPPEDRLTIRMSELANSLPQTVTHVIDVGELDDTVIDRMQSDFKYVAKVVKAVRHNKPTGLKGKIYPDHFIERWNLLAELTKSKLVLRNCTKYFPQKKGQRTM